MLIDKDRYYNILQMKINVLSKAKGKGGHMILPCKNLFVIILFVSSCLGGCGHTIEKKEFLEKADVSDYEVLNEEEGTDVDENTPQIEADRKSHRPAEGTAARKFYDRLAYIMGNLRITEYVHYKNKIMDEDNGIYKYDCSGFVSEFILKQVLPKHYEDLVSNAKKYHKDDHPRAWGLYDYFNEILSKKTENKNSYWHVFTSMEKIQPGDIIVVKYDENWRNSIIEKCKSASTGHVMTAWSYPVRSGKEFSIYVIDSSGSGHCKDTRRTTYDDVSGTNGIGKGRMYYGVDQKDQRPVYYRWSSSISCQYTLTDMKSNCDGKDKDLCCTGKNCDYPRKYYERLQGIIIARPIS